jgi:hypothetical protein
MTMFETDATALVAFAGLIACLLRCLSFDVQHFFDACLAVIDIHPSVEGTAEVVPF